MTAAVAELVQDGALTIQQVQELIPLSRSQLYALMADGSLVYSEVGGRRLIPRRAALALLASGLKSVKPTAK